MSATASKLDTEKFRKVHGLMTGGATEGERSAAQARAEAMAMRAGMTLKDAVSSLDSRPAPRKAKSLFEEMEDAMEAAHPGHKAEWAAQEVKRQHANEALRKEALKEFGSEDALWAETEQERLLRETLEPLADWGRYANVGASPGGSYIKGYAGWTAGAPPWPLMEALMKAYPFAPDLPGLWREYQEWERLYAQRHAFMRHYDFDAHVRARMAALRFNLDTFSDPTFEGFEARLAWLKFRTENDWSNDVDEDLSMIATMRVDFAMLRATYGPKGGSKSEHPLPRTNAEKRAAVLSMLDAHPELSDREIARRLGVSPQTVNTRRKRQ